jgi:hypothetical protein
MCCVCEGEMWTNTSIYQNYLVLMRECRKYKYAKLVAIQWLKRRKLTLWYGVIYGS